MEQRTENPEQRFVENGTTVMTDGSGNDPEETENEAENSTEEETGGLVNTVKNTLGIGENHVQPENEVEESLEADSEVNSAEELSDELSDLDSVVESYDETRSELEADIQATAQSYETEISEGAGNIADKLNAVMKVAEGEPSHTYEFDPERGTHSLDYEGPETIVENEEDEEDGSVVATDYNFDIEEGLATFLAEGAKMGDAAMSQFDKIQQDMKSLKERRDDLNDELEKKKERNEDQLEKSRSEFTTEEEEKRAEAIQEAENAADEEEINNQLSEVNDELSRKRPRKETHLDIGNEVLDEVQTTYNEHASKVKTKVTEISEEVGYLTDALDQLTSVEIGSMEEMLKDAFEDTDVEFEAVGKYLQDAEGDLNNAYRDAVNDLTTRVAKQYQQAEQAIEEISFLEDSITNNTERLDLDITSGDLRDTLDDAYDGEDMETYLEDQVSDVLDATYSARDDIRDVFRGLEELRDEQQLAQ